MYSTPSAKNYIGTRRSQYGTITHIDGSLILVRPKYRRWETECYPEELKYITKNSFKEISNYTNK